MNNSASMTVTGRATEAVTRLEIVPMAARIAFRRTIGHAKSVEQMLWRDVAARMTLDALGITPEVITIRDGMDKAAFKQYAKSVEAARIWFTRKKRDSEMVFELAGVDITHVRDIIKAMPALQAPKDMRRAKPRPERRLDYTQQAA